MRSTTYKLTEEIFCPEIIMNSGQVFRIQNSDRQYFAKSGANELAFERLDSDTVEFTCEEDQLPFWEKYFDFGTDYAKMNALIRERATAAGDSFLVAALDNTPGMRILRQDLWETFISYIISQNNNIPKIKKSINILCERYSDGSRFPTADELAKVPLDELKTGTMLGYRAEYISRFSNDMAGGCFEEEMQPLMGKSFSEVYDELIKIHGIGPKVASCIALYGFHCMDSYPIDTWMKHIIGEDYPMYTQKEYMEYINSSYEGFQGYVQQLQFYYKRVGQTPA